MPGNWKSSVFARTSNFDRFPRSFCNRILPNPPALPLQLHQHPRTFREISIVHQKYFPLWIIGRNCLTKLCRNSGQICDRKILNLGAVDQCEALAMLGSETRDDRQLLQHIGRDDRGWISVAWHKVFFLSLGNWNQGDLAKHF